MTVLKGSKFLQETYIEAEKLYYIAKDYFNTQANYDILKLHGDAQFAYTLVMSNIDVKLTSTLGFIDQLNSLDACSSIEEKRAVLEKFINLSIADEEYHGYLSKMLFKLSHSSSKLYQRIEQLYASLLQDNSFKPENANQTIWGARNVLKFKPISDGEAAIAAKG